MESISLYNGIKMPRIGLGTYGLKPGDEMYQTVLNALNLGYRHIDTAIIYHNEKDVGRAIKDSNIPRDELFITSKLPPHIKTYDGALRFFHRSLENLGLTYIDLYIINAPRPFHEVKTDLDPGNFLAYQALEKLYEEELVSAIGLSNFDDVEISTLMLHTSVKPHVLQSKHHVGFINQAYISFAHQHDITIQAYSPLAKGNVFSNEQLNQLAQKYDVEAAQIALGYLIAKGLSPIVKSSQKKHLETNIKPFISLMPKDIIELDQLSK